MQTFFILLPASQKADVGDCINPFVYMYVSAWVGYKMYLFSALVSWHTVLKALSSLDNDRSSGYIFYSDISWHFLGDRHVPVY